VNHRICLSASSMKPTNPHFAPNLLRYRCLLRSCSARQQDVFTPETRQVAFSLSGYSKSSILKTQPGLRCRSRRPPARRGAAAASRLAKPLSAGGYSKSSKCSKPCGRRAFLRSPLHPQRKEPDGGWACALPASYPAIDYSETSHPPDFRSKYGPIDRLVFYARNPRKNGTVVDRMCSSIREFGFKLPVLARSDGEVVGGHLHLKAARKLGITEFPVILCDEWTP
jgi:ParB-like nuclease domain